MRKSRETVYKSLESGMVRDFYESPDTARHVLDLAAENNLDEQQTTAFAQIVGDAILGIHTLDELPRCFEDASIPSEESFALTNEVRALLAPIRSGTENEAPIEPSAFQQVNTVPAQPAPITTPSAPHDATPAPATPQQSSAQPQPAPGASPVAELRTMQGDAERIHGYGAYRRRMREKDGLPPDDESESSTHADVPKYSNE